VNVVEAPGIEDTGAMSTTLSEELLAILACPEDKGPLHYLADEDVLYNVRTHRRYDIRDGIPIMLIDESTLVDDDEHARLVALIEANGIQPTFSP
jgi:uncharacterized protein YbaR (Trm112 family)